MGETGFLENCHHLEMLQINLRGNPGDGNGVWAGGATPGTGGTAPGGGNSGYPSP